MHDKLFSDGLIGDLCHHSVDGLTAELVFPGVWLNFQQAFIDHFGYSFHFADVVGHKGHVNWLWVRLFFDKETALFESVCQFVAAEVSADEWDDGGFRLCQQFEGGVILDVLYKELDLK